MTPAQLIAQNLAALPHPDGTPRQMPGFHTRLLPEPMQEEISKAAQEIADSIVHLLDTNGYRILTDEQLSQTLTIESRQANVYCNLCGEEVLTLNISNPHKVMTDFHFDLQKCPHG